jgi:hypothetical protein
MRIPRDVEGSQPFQKFQPEANLKDATKDVKLGEGTSCGGSCGCDSADGCAECGCGRSPDKRK